MSVLLEGVIGLLAEAVFHGIMEVLMKLLTGKFGIWWGVGGAVGAYYYFLCMETAHLKEDELLSRVTAKVQTLPPTPFCCQSPASAGAFAFLTRSALGRRGAKHG